MRSRLEYDFLHLVERGEGANRAEPVHLFIERRSLKKMSLRLFDNLD